MNLQLFVSTFILIFVAELPDKTAFATVILAARDRAVAVFTGVALAFLVQTIVAVAFGSVFALMPTYLVHGIAGLIFFAFAVHLWRSANDPHVDDCAEVKTSSSFFRSAWRAFLVIFIAEWGDLTQIATASLIAKFPEDRITVFAAAILALWSVTAVAVLLGRQLKTTLNPSLLKKGCAVICFLVGSYMIVELVRDRFLHA